MDFSLADCLLFYCQRACYCQRFSPFAFSVDIYCICITSFSANLSMCLCSYIQIVWILFVGHGLPIHGAAIVTYVVLVVLIVIPAFTTHQWKTAGTSAAMLLGLMGLAMLALPWDFFGTPSVAPFIGEGMMQINPQMIKTMIDKN